MHGSYKYPYILFYQKKLSSMLFTCRAFRYYQLPHIIMECICVLVLQQLPLVLVSHLRPLVLPCYSNENETQIMSLRFVLSHPTGRDPPPAINTWRGAGRAAGAHEVWLQQTCFELLIGFKCISGWNQEEICTGEGFVQNVAACYRGQNPESEFRV